MITIDAAQLQPFLRELAVPLLGYAGVLLGLMFVAGFLFSVLSNFIFEVMVLFVRSIYRRFLCRRCISYDICGCGKDECRGYVKKRKKVDLKLVK